MTLDEAVTYLREALDKVDPTVHTEFRMSPQEVEQFLYWLREYKAMTSGRQSDNLSERLAEHLVWAESNSYECPVTLAEDLQEAISDLNDKGKTISNLIENIKCLQSESSWISCSAKMPDDDEAVLFVNPWNEGKKPKVALGRHHTKNGKGWWTTYYSSFSEYEIHNWMPLPEPPKEVTE